MQVHAPCPRALAPPSPGTSSRTSKLPALRTARDRAQMPQPFGQDFRHADVRHQSGPAPKGGIS